MLGVSGRIGKNDTQITKHYETYLRNNDTKKGLKYQRFYSDNNEDVNATEFECNEQWFKEALKALKYSEINKIVSDLEDLIYTGQIQWYKLQLET